MLALALIAACGRSKVDEPAAGSAIVKDATVDADTWKLTGPPNAEALARAYLQALADVDGAALERLLITPELATGLYDCDQRPDYPLVQRIESSRIEARHPLSEAERWKRDRMRVEVGAWPRSSASRSWPARRSRTCAARGTRRTASRGGSSLCSSIRRGTERPWSGTSSSSRPRTQRGCRRSGSRTEPEPPGHSPTVT
ncbi:MAG TPA: hypothetical protein VFQ53_34195 [Kofleriaceae bacterium]|nr:hypothetical protein [Kofleriaceae bacterium]